MMKFVSRLRPFTRSHLVRDTRGLSTVEYVILLAFIAVGGIALWTTFGNNIDAAIENANTKTGNLQSQ